MAVAAQDALPGDALYPIKRLIEGAETGAQRQRGRQGQLAARQRRRPPRRGHRACSRDERPRRGRRDRRHPRRLQPTRPSRPADLLLADYAATGDRDVGRRAARRSPAQSMETLAELEAVAPARARATRCSEAAQVLAQIDAAASAGLPACAAAGIDRDPGRRLRQLGGVSSPEPTVARSPPLGRGAEPSTGRAPRPAGSRRRPRRDGTPAAATAAPTGQLETPGPPHVRRRPTPVDDPTGPLDDLARRRPTGLRRDRPTRPAPAASATAGCAATPSTSSRRRRRASVIDLLEDPLAPLTGRRLPGAARQRKTDSRSISSV